MTLFIKLENGQPVSHPVVEENFRTLFPNESFAPFFTADNVEPLGFGIYDYSNQPSCGRYEKAVEVTPVRNESGIWKQTWQVVPMTAEEKQKRDDTQAENMRMERNYRLALSDWTQAPDAPVDKDAWGVYRQALRDVPQQAGFPWDIQWPVQPV